MKTIYTATLDTLSKILTIFVFLIFIGVIIVPLIIDPANFTFKDGRPWVSIASGIFFLVLFGIVYLYRVLRYELTDDELIIVRPINSVSIPLNSITGVTKLEKTELFPGTIRTFGNGGFLGYTGYFWNRTYGTMLFYLTQRKNLILIETIAKPGKTKGGKIVVSPDDIGMEGKLIELLKGIRR
jgi:hypothetical protein